MKLLLIRHGETNYNKQRKLMGSGIDAPLNEEGVRQAHETAGNIDDTFDVIVSSPLKRALQTAEIIAAYFNKEVVVNNDIKERDFGSIAGRSWDEVEKITGGDATVEKDRVHQYDYTPYGGESADGFKERILRFLNTVERDYPDKIVLVSTHGGVIRLMHHLFSKKENLNIKNASMHEFNF